MIRIREQDGLRLLDFGTPWCQGAMRLDDPDALEMAYAVRMFGWLLFHDVDTLGRQHVVTLGLGAGSLTKFAWRVLGMQATAVEIDHEVIEACHAHFDLPREGDGLRLVHADARDYVTACQRGADVIQVDAYDAAVERPALDDEPFHAACRTCLREGGTLAVNLVGAAMDARASVARLRVGLQPRAVWQFPPTAAGNVVVLAHRGDVPPEDVLAARAEAIEDRWDLPAAQWLAMARRT
ncbi:spermidine synthase [Ramlibacter algicola]|uniref:Spermidine synthase n=1 Tax=Ramlibacter algicola TaxID=2795217 RepID=A0A934USB9_9BURK|nr:spermidine synthase [Ramlibacter algicola]MBK0393716.1 spermidine synthase [Ramlibacter algicola]